jgi:hypothetical protein
VLIDTDPETACVAGKLTTETLAVPAMFAVRLEPETPIGLATVHAEMAMSSPMVKSPDTAIGLVFATNTLAVGENDVTATDGIALTDN